MMGLMRLPKSSVRTEVDMGTKGSKLHLACGQWKKQRNDTSVRKRQIAVSGLLDGILGTFQSQKTHAPELKKIDMEGSGSLDGSSEDAFGPLAVILVGYQIEEFEAFRKCMLDMDADMVKALKASTAWPSSEDISYEVCNCDIVQPKQLICCSGPQLELEVGKVLESPPPMIEQPRLGTRRAVILSGMIAEELNEVIGAYRDAGLPETVWAAAVPANYDRQIFDLIEDIYGDHMYLRNNPEAVP